MHLQILSDLHLETHPHFRAQPAPGANLLVLAGDIGSYQNGSMLPDEDFGLAQFSPQQAGGHWPEPVILVPGNHEFDAQDFETARSRLRASCNRLGIVMLDGETVVIDGVRFVGTTLWSDYDAIALHNGVTELGALMKQREKAYKAANFYLTKAEMMRDGQPFLAAEMREEALRCQAWLRTGRALRWQDRRHHPLCAQPQKRRPTLWPHPRHRWLLQCAGRPAALCRPVDSRPPACTQRLPGKRHACRWQSLAVPRGGQPPGLCPQGGAGDIQPALCGEGLKGQCWNFGGLLASRRDIHQGAFCTKSLHWRAWAV